MAVPKVPTFNDWHFELVNLATGSFTNLDQSIVAISGWVGRGATRHRLESAHLEILDGSVGAIALSWAGIQLLRIVPYADPTHELWGYISKDRHAYSKSGHRDSIKITVLPIEYLLHSRIVYETDNVAAAPVTIATEAAPNNTGGDYAKTLVTACTHGRYPTAAAADTRDWAWGALFVAAQVHDGAVVAPPMSLFAGFLDEAVDALGQTYDFDWELYVAVVAGVVQFTFTTDGAGGSDLTAGVARVIINDIGALVPSAERYFDRQGMINAMHGGAISTAVLDAPSVATWGRWEGEVATSVDEELQLVLDKSGIKEGSTFEFQASAASEQCQWMDEYEVGDTVKRNNIRLSIADNNEIIQAIEFSFPNRVLQTRIRWGNKEPGDKEKTRQGRYTPFPPVPPTLWSRHAASAYLYPTSLGDDIRIKDAAGVDKFEIDGATGDISLHDRAEARFYDNGNYVGFEAPALGADQIWTLPVADGGVGDALITDGAGALSWGVPSSSFWERGDIDATGAVVTGLFTRFPGDPVMIGADSSIEVANWQSDAGYDTKFHVEGNIWVGRLVHTTTNSLALCGWHSATENIVHIFDPAGRISKLDVYNIGVRHHMFDSDIANPSYIRGFFEIHDAAGAIGHTFNAVTGVVTLNVQRLAGGDFSALAQAAGVTILGTDANTRDLILNNVPHLWPAADAIGALISDGGGGLSWGAPVPAAHDLLSASHGDTLAAGVTRGSVIYGNATPDWAELVKGADNTVLACTATDVAFEAIADLAVTSVAAGTGLTGGGGPGAITIDAVGGTGLTAIANAINLDDTAVAPGAYGDATHVGTFTVDQQGRLTAAADVLIAGVAPAAHDILSASHGDTLAGVVVDGDVIIGNVTPAWSRLARAVPAANVRNVLGIDNGETRPSWKTALDANDPTAIGINDAAAPGTSLIFSHRDHQHASPATWTATAHNLLSAIHGDTVVSAMTRGDLVVGTAGGWDDLAIGAANTYLHSDNTDATWQQIDHAHIGNVLANQHHAEIHVVNSGGPHAEAGLTIGHVLRVSGAAAFSFAALQAGDITGLSDPGTCTVATANAVGPPHTHAITTSANPGAAASILASTAAGLLQLVGLGIGTAATAADRINFGAAGTYIEEGLANDLKLVAADDVYIQATDAVWIDAIGGSITLYTASVARWVVTATYLAPSANNSYTLGTAARRPSNVYSVLGNFSGDITLADGVAIRCAGAPVMTFDDTNAVLIVTGAHLRVGYDTDLTSYFGRAAIGFDGVSADVASFAHIDVNNATDYALWQGALGTTVLNAAAGHNIYFRINNVSRMVMSAAITQLWSGQDLELHSGAGGTLVASIDGATGLIDTAIGYTVATAAANRHVLIGDGAKGVFRALVAADLPAVSNIWTKAAANVYTTTANDCIIPNSGTGTIGLTAAVNRWDYGYFMNLAVTTAITMGDDGWIGIGAAAERIVFDAAGDIAVMGANFGIGTLVPTSALAFGASAVIQIETADGSDTGQLIMSSAAGGGSSARGAAIILRGNEHGSPGEVRIFAGNVAGGDVFLQTAGATRLLVTHAGDVELHNAADLLVYDDGNLKASIDGATGDLFLHANATTQFGGGTYTWPANDGAAGQLLSTSDGAGTLAWIAPAASAEWTDTGAFLHPTNARDVKGDAGAAPGWELFAAGGALFRGNVSIGWGTAHAQAFFIDANTYISAAVVFQMVTDLPLVVFAPGGGGPEVEVGVGYLEPTDNNATTCGRAASRWSNAYSVLGNFSGDVTIANAAGIINTGRITNRFVLISDGTRFQGRALVAADLGGHVHVITGDVGAGTAHSHALDGHTTGWVLYGSRCDGTNPVRDVGGTIRYVRIADDAGGTNARWELVYIGTNGHYHQLSGTSGGCETIAANCSPTDDENAHTHDEGTLVNAGPS